MKGNTTRVLKTIPLHLVFWVGAWFFFFWFFSYNSPNRSYVVWFSSLLLPLTMAITYFAVYFLIPRFLLAKKYFKFALYLLYTLIASSYFIVLLIYGSLYFILKFDTTGLPPMVKNFFFILILVYLIVGIVGFISILNNSFIAEKRNKDLQNKILETQLQLKEQELQYLKNQIHPHFLFNTLNTIYGFALKQSKQTPDIILKLSNLLDYILYQVNKPMVPLKEEVDHIREYIDLERIRFRDTLSVRFNSNDIPEDIEIAPMLLIPFVENAFKHGKAVDGTLLVNIDISVENTSLEFKIQNTWNSEIHQDKSGIGMQNLEKRLEINYPGDYTLKQEEDKEWYYIELNISKLRRGGDEQD